jgi:hypothetical protein
VTGFALNFRRRLRRRFKSPLSFVFFECHGEHYLTTDPQREI